MIDIDNNNNILFIMYVIDYLLNMLKIGKDNGDGNGNDNDNDDKIVGLFRISPDSNSLSLLVEKSKEFLFSYELRNDETFNDIFKKLDFDIDIDINKDNTKSGDGYSYSFYKNRNKVVTFEAVEEFFKNFELKTKITLTTHLVASLIKWIIANLEEPLLPFDFCVEETKSSYSATPKKQSVWRGGEEMIIKTIYHHIAKRRSANKILKQISPESLLQLLKCSTKLIYLLHLISKEKRSMMTPYNLYVVIFPPICTSRAKDAPKYLFIENEVITELNKRRRISLSNGEKAPITKLEDLIQNGDKLNSYITGLIISGSLTKGVSAMSNHIDKEFITKEQNKSKKQRWNIFRCFLTKPNIIKRFSLSKNQPLNDIERNRELIRSENLKISNLDEFIKRYPSISNSPGKNSILSIKVVSKPETSLKKSNTQNTPVKRSRLKRHKTSTSTKIDIVNFKEKLPMNSSPLFPLNVNECI